MALTVIIRNIQQGVKNLLPNRAQVMNFLNEALFPETSEDCLQFQQPKEKLKVQKNKPD
jgi:hypothetical protein